MTNLDLVQKIDLDLHLRLERVLSEFPELGGVSSPPQEQLLELAPFLLDTPQKYYDEATYENGLRYLTDHYAARPGDLVDDFTYVADWLRLGMLNTEYYSRVVEDTPTSQLTRDGRIRDYWSRWYLNLVEECLKHVSAPLVRAVLRDRGRSTDLEDMPYVSNRLQVLGTVSELAQIGKHFADVVRNACAHGGVALLRDNLLMFRDNRGNEVEWPDDEFLDYIHGMLDVCNALTFAASVFVLRNWSQLAALYSHQSLPERERERVFLTVASTPVIDVRSAEIIDCAGTRQVAIDATDRALGWGELAYDAVAILERAYKFYPDVDQVFLALSGKRHLPSWVRAPMPAVRDWVSGSLDLETFPQTPGVELMIFPFKRWAIPVPTRIIYLRRVLASGLPQLRAEFEKARRNQERPWRIVEVRDKSTALAKRLEVIVVVPNSLSRRNIEPMLVETTLHVRRHLYRTEEKVGYKRRYRKAMALRPAGYVWLLVFTKEKRPSDMWADPSASYYVCRTEWFDERQRSNGLQPMLNLPDRVDGSDITVEWSPRYPT